jgi:hypothetical protein
MYGLQGFKAYNNDGTKPLLGDTVFVVLLVKRNGCVWDLDLFTGNQAPHTHTHTLTYVHTYCGHVRVMVEAKPLIHSKESVIKHRLFE